MDKIFPEPVLDDRFALIVQIITDTVAEHGYAEMRNVPGDQQTALRKQVRSAVRQRTGHGLQTPVHESMVRFICEPISQQHTAEHARTAADAIRARRSKPRARSLLRHVCEQEKQKENADRARCDRLPRTQALTFTSLTSGYSGESPPTPRGGMLSTVLFPSLTRLLTCRNVAKWS